MHRLVTGRPPTSAELTALIERLATENNGWGVQELCRTLHNQRIQGELTGLGYKIAPSTVWRILDNAGIDPAPTRSGRPGGRSWPGRPRPSSPLISSTLAPCCCAAFRHQYSG
jgi:hypothetical protein